MFSLTIMIIIIIVIIKLGKDSSTSPPQVLAMADIMAGTTLEDLEYSDEESEVDSDEDYVNQVKLRVTKRLHGGVGRALNLF